MKQLGRHSNFFIYLFIGFLFLASCGKKKTAEVTDEPSTGNTIVSGDSQCIKIYFDDVQAPNNRIGKSYAIMIANLLGHFPNWNRYIAPINNYLKNDLAQCKANIYVGSFYNNMIPVDFWTDLSTQKNPFMWLGYNIWQADPSQLQRFGFSFAGLTRLDFFNLNSKGEPSFFSDVLYKSETFEKYGSWSQVSNGVYLAAFEQSILSLNAFPGTQVLANSRNPVTGATLPWAVRNNNLWYISEVPLSFITESDRYLIFSDLLFDFLGEIPREKKRNALLRLEDIHAMSDLESLEMALAALQKENVSAILSIIPHYRDPLDHYDYGNRPFLKSLSSATDLLNLLKKYPTEISWHGVTHQYSNWKNPYSGVSGDDYEFWDANANSPTPENTSDQILTQMANGHSEFIKAKLTPKSWVTPHYKASVLANKIFADVFFWNIGRNVYFQFSQSGSLRNPNDYGFFNFVSDKDLSPLKAKFKNYQVAQSNLGIEQFYPYSIINDYYGQNFVPENLGNVQNDLNDQVTRTRTVDQILRDAQRNLVIRDAWASVFYHPFLLLGQDPINNDLTKLIKGLKALGYQFTSIEAYGTYPKITATNKLIDLSPVNK